MRMLVLLLLVSCAHRETVKGYAQMMVKYKGEPAGKVIDAFGYPDREFERGDLKVMEYSRGSETITGTKQDIGFGISTVSSTVDRRQCITWFEVKEGIVQEIRWRGNSCKAREVRTKSR